MCRKPILTRTHSIDNIILDYRYLDRRGSNSFEHNSYSFSLDLLCVLPTRSHLGSLQKHHSSTCSKKTQGLREIWKNERIFPTDIILKSDSRQLFRWWIGWNPKDISWYICFSLAPSIRPNAIPITDCYASHLWKYSIRNKYFPGLHSSSTPWKKTPTQPSGL